MVVALDFRVHLLSNREEQEEEMNRALFFMTLLTIAGCGGGGSPVAPDSVEVVEPDVADKDAVAPLDADEVAEVRQGEIELDGAPEVADEVSEPLPTLPPDKLFTTRYAAGAASAIADPPDGAGHYLGGFGFCAGNEAACRVSEGQHDSLWVVAVALADPENGEVVIFVGIDSLGLIKHDMVAAQTLASDMLAEQMGIHLDHHRVVISSSHSHSGIDSVGLWGPMTSDVREEEEYIQHLLQTIASTAVKAFGNLEDAELDWGVSEAPNHDEDLAPDDEVVWALRGRNLAGETLFTLTRWPAHPTKYGSGSNAISADWVGPFRKKMEAEEGGVAAYLNGPIGSVYTDFAGECTETDAFPDGFQDPDVGPGGHANVACQGYQVADAALAALDAAQPLAETGIVHRYADFDFHPSNFLFAGILELSAVPWEPVDPKDPDSTVTSRLSWTTVGDLQYLTTPGESFPSVGYAAADILSQAGYTNTIVLGLAQDWMGYLLMEEQWPQENLGYYRSLSPGPEVAPAYLKRLSELVSTTQP